MRGRTISLGLLIIVLLTGSAFGALIIQGKRRQEQQAERWRQMRQLASLSDMEDEVTEIPVDFAGLQKINPEIYAWITIPGTRIDSPVVQSRTDEQFYLTHSAQGQEAASGAIFSESRNKTDFSDAHTVLYGANAADGTMFADLHRFEDEDFFRNYKVIAVYTPQSVCYYQIFAAYPYDDRNLLQSYDSTDAAAFSNYIQNVRGQRNLYAHIDTEIEIGQDARILTLSTEDSAGDSYRYLVQAVLKKTINAK